MKKCTRAEIVVVWGEGVSESLWKHHKSKEHEILHRCRYQKKSQFVFYHGENQIWKIFFKKKIWISEKNILRFFSIEKSFKIDFWKLDFKWLFDWKKISKYFFGEIVSFFLLRNFLFTQNKYFWMIFFPKFISWSRRIDLAQFQNDSGSIKVS